MIVETLAEAGVDNPWGQQQIAIGYEQERGIRKIGETADAGFEIGVQRTLAISQDHQWELLLSSEGRRLWLGNAPAVEFEPVTTYEMADGILGKLRTFKPGERLRLTWHPADWDAELTLQITLARPRNSIEKTFLQFHQERLADSDIRETMREYWRDVLDRLEDHVDDESGRESTEHVVERNRYSCGLTRLLYP